MRGPHTMAITDRALQLDFDERRFRFRLTQASEQLQRQAASRPFIPVDGRRQNGQEVAQQVLYKRQWDRRRFVNDQQFAVEQLVSVFRLLSTV